MEQNQIETIYKLIAKNLRVDISKVTPEATFEKDLKADSLDIVELFIDIEDAFGLSINIEELQGTIVNVQDVVNAIDKLIAEK